MTSIAIMGTGYVGLTTGAYLAHLGHRVTSVDVVEEKVALLRQGILPIFEPGLDDLVHAGIANGRLSFEVGPLQAVPGAEVVFLCLPTPQGEDGSADLSYVMAAAAEIGPLLAPGAVVVNKSTVPIGTTHTVARLLGRPDVHVVSNPEFLREGSALHDCLHPDRIVVGADDAGAAELVTSLFSALDATVVVTDPASAETIKYASNAFLATKVSFINAMSSICEAVGADITEVAHGMGLDERIGRHFLKPGPGWGGSCFGKDSRALIRIAEDVDVDFHLLRSAVTTNDEQLERMVAKVARMAGGLTGARIAVWGLTFKADTDDLRKSPAIAIIRRLVEEGAEVHAYDPAVHQPLDDIELYADASSAVDDADVLVVLTEWAQFLDVDLVDVGRRMRTRRIVDTRNLFDPQDVAELGFAYDGVGRAAAGEPVLALLDDELVRLLDAG